MEVRVRHRWLSCLHLSHLPSSTETSTEDKPVTNVPSMWDKENRLDTGWKVQVTAYQSPPCQPLSFPKVHTRPWVCRSPFSELYICTTNKTKCRLF